MAIAAADRSNALESGLWIGEELVSSTAGGTMEHVNAVSGRVQKEFAVASREEVDAAVGAAREAFPAWRDWQPDARRQALLRLADLLEANAEMLGTVCTLEAANLFSPYNAIYVAEYFRYYAGWCDKLTGDSVRPYPFTGIDYTMPEPVGVVGIFVASNGPLGFCGMAGAPALAAGCSIVIKAPELAPFSPIPFARLCREAGIPAGVVNVITGGPDVGNALASHPGVAKISFTGGIATARKLQEACAATLKPLVMELGGKSAHVVFADADIDAAIGHAARFTGNAGQGCSLPTRLLVERPVYDRVVEGVAAAAESVVVGDPFDPATTMGPVISNASLGRILGLVTDAVDSGARVVTGGDRMGGELADGFFVAPTVLAEVDPASRIAQTEIFGPVLSVIPFDTEQEAVEIANATEFGLAAYVQTTDMGRAHRMVRALEAGSVHVNSSGPGPLSPSIPFGGVKQSGYGRQGGREGINEFLHTKNVYFNV